MRAVFSCFANLSLYWALPMVGRLDLKCPTLFRFIDSGRQNYSCPNRLSGLFCGWGLFSDVEVQKILLNPAEYIE